MLNQTKKLSFIILALFIVSSCAHKTPNKLADAAYTPKLDVEKVAADNSEHLDIVREAQEIDTIDGQVVGSASIEKSNAHKKHVYFLYGAEHLKLKNYYFDIPVVYNAPVKKWMNYFLSRGKEHFTRYTERAGRYAPVLGKILEDHGLPRDLIFLAMAESGFHNNAKSWAKAVGPWQFMPFTGKKFGLDINWYLDERRDPIKATIAASKYLGFLYNKFGSWELAASAYNAGEGKIGRAIRRYRTKNFWKITRGRYLRAETKNYVPKIMALAIIGKNLESFGFDDISFHRPLDFDEIEVSGNTDLYKVSEAINVEFDELKKLNPELMRWITPPDVDTYKLRIPVGKRYAFESCCSGKDLEANEYYTYRIKGKRGATLRNVAKRFRIKDVKVLETLNGVKSKKTLARGTMVVLPFHASHNKKENMYSDLYEKPSRRVRRARSYRSRIRRAKSNGKLINNPSEYYTVRKGDTLWSVARKHGVSLDTLIRSNLSVVQKRMIRVGDRLVIR